MPLPAVSTLKGGVAEGAGSVDYTPPMAKHLQLLRLHAERGSSGRGSWHESFSLVFWVSQRIENKCRKREIGKERDGEKDKRQDSKTKQQKTQHSTSFYAELRCCSCDKSWTNQRTTWRMRNVAAWPTNGGCKDARSAKIMIHMAQITHKKHTVDTHTHTCIDTLWGKLASSKTALRREELANALRCWPKSHKSRIPCDKTCHMLPLATGISMSPRKSRKKADTKTKAKAGGQLC